MTVDIPAACRGAAVTPGRHSVRPSCGRMRVTQVDDHRWEVALTFNHASQATASPSRLAARCPLWPLACSPGRRSALRGHADCRCSCRKLRSCRRPERRCAIGSGGDGLPAKTEIHEEQGGRTDP